MIHIGFTGSSKAVTPLQRGALLQLVVAARRTFQWKIVYHHGDCIHADAVLHVLVYGMHNTLIEIHPPTLSAKRAFCTGLESLVTAHEAKSYLKRNDDIAASDILFAAPDGPEHVRSGTWSTIRRARKKGIPIYLAWPDGKVTVEASRRGVTPIDISGVTLAAAEVGANPDLQWWREAAAKVGCRVHGWTHRSVATFEDPISHKHVEVPGWFAERLL